MQSGYATKASENVPHFSEAFVLSKIIDDFSLLTKKMPDWQQNSALKIIP
jgi:hypothetical protein